MATNWYAVVIVAVVAILLLLLIFWLLRRIKKKKESKLATCPPEMLRDFEEAERKLKQSDGSISPYQILWEVASKNAYNKTEIKSIKEEINNGDSLRKESSRESRGIYLNNQAEQSNQYTGVGRATENIPRDRQDISGDRKYGQGQSLPIQSDSNSSENKRKPKTNWANFG